MKKKHPQPLFRTVYIILFLQFLNPVLAQGPSTVLKQSDDFWKNVQFGGGLGLNFSSGYTDIVIAPSAIYNFNPFVAAGAGLNFNYVSSNNYYSSLKYGISSIFLVNPLPQIQLSIGLNESRVNYQEEGLSNYFEDYWHTSLIVGVGYRTGNITVGISYDLIQSERYSAEPIVPFVRAYF
jgi:hypothetical protein